MRVQGTLDALRQIEATLDENGVHTVKMWQLFLDLVASARVIAEDQPGSARKLVWDFKQLEAKTEGRIAMLARQA